MSKKSRARPPDGRKRPPRQRRPKRTSLQEQLDASFSMAPALLAHVVAHWTDELPRALNAALIAKRTTVSVKPLDTELRRALELLRFFARHVSFAGGVKSECEEKIDLELGIFGSFEEQTDEQPLRSLCDRISLDLRRRTEGLPLEKGTAALLGVTEADVMCAFLAMEWVLTMPIVPRRRERPRKLDSQGFLHGPWIHSQRRSGIFTGPRALRWYSVATQTPPTRAVRTYWSRAVKKYDSTPVESLLDEPSMAPIRPDIPRRK